jgi:hypothetical protein
LAKTSAMTEGRSQSAAVVSPRNFTRKHYW